MSGTATLNVRMDADTKRDFTMFCEEVGISASSLMNIFARTVVRNQEIPFPMTTKQLSDTSSFYRSIFPETENELFNKLEESAATPTEQCTPMDQATTDILERLGW